MLASFHYPVADLRGFFSDALGRVRNPLLSGAFSVEPGFIRSVGVPRRRLLGGGDQFLSERFFFSFDRSFELTRRPSNRGFNLRLDPVRAKKRYYQFDSIAGRFDVSIPIHFARKDGAEARRIETLFTNLRMLDLTTRKSYLAQTNHLGQASAQFRKFYQSRTTREKLLRYGKPYPALFGGTPLLLVEAVEGELNLGQELQPISSGIDGLALYHGYVTRNMRAWVIVRASRSRADFIASRLLRMYLSRLFCQQDVFRELVRNVPGLAQAAAGDSTFMADLYSAYLAESRRFIASLSASAARVTGQEFGLAARYAFDSISTDEVAAIVDQHDEILTRKNIFRNLREDILADVAMGEHLRSADPPVVSKNFVFAFFSKVYARQSIENQVPIARREFQNLEIVERLQDLADFFAVFGSQVDRGRQESITALMLEMQKLASSKTIPGPAVAERLTRLRSLMEQIPVGRDKLEEVLSRLEKAVLT